MRARLVMGNWKMHGDTTTITQLLSKLLDGVATLSEGECVVFPPSVYLPLVRDRLQDSPLHWGAQNVYPKSAGAFTGEISSGMLLEMGCRYVLVGHSERRQLFFENEHFIAEKFHHVKDRGMIPVLCVGETLSEREEGLMEAVLTRQLSAVFRAQSLDFRGCVIAYEPVWAIGTGRTAAPEQAQEAHAFIRGWVAKMSHEDALCLPIVYGGSVNEKNARAIFAMPDVDGGLVGGASLHAEQFLEIVKCINCY